MWPTRPGGLLLVFFGSPWVRELGLMAQAAKPRLVLRVLGLQQPWFSGLGENPAGHLGFGGG